MKDTIFKVEQKSSEGRRGILYTRRGALKTPFFMPDATRASVRGISKEQLISVGVDPMVVNTYHLLLQPGTELLEKSGDIHSFMNWDGPLLSDSGGYQVYSLIHKNKKLGKITEDGAEFRSIMDGSLHVLTPERAIEVQFAIGTDMMVVLDDPRPTNASRRDHEGAVERTVRWAQRCLEEYSNQVEKRNLTDKTRPLIFCVVQGGPYKDLREKCAKDLQALSTSSKSGLVLNWDGYGFGGRHVDENGVFMEEIIAHTAICLPVDKPRFALGIGTPEDIVRCHALGWDFFDCVIPTREGRHGRLFLWKKDVKDDVKIKKKDDFYETVNIKNNRFKEDFTPIDNICNCYACEHYSRAYLHHLFRVGEPLGAQMAALHNLKFYMKLMESLREAEL